jgi:hypothetical protein
MLRTGSRGSGQVLRVEFGDDDIVDAFTPPSPEVLEYIAKYKD